MRLPYRVLLHSPVLLLLSGLAGSLLRCGARFQVPVQGLAFALVATLAVFVRGPRRLGRMPQSPLLHFLRSSCSAQPCPIPWLPGVPEALFGGVHPGGTIRVPWQGLWTLGCLPLLTLPTRGALCALLYALHSGVTLEDRFHSLDPEPALRKVARASGRGV